MIEEEPGASGKLTTAFFKSKLPGFVVNSIKSEKKKKDRAFQVAVAQNSGLIKLVPGEWNETFINEAIAFTGEKDKDAHDDQIDAWAMAYNWLNDYDLPATFASLGSGAEVEEVEVAVEIDEVEKYLLVYGSLRAKRVGYGKLSKSKKRVNV